MDLGLELRRVADLISAELGRFFAEKDPDFAELHEAEEYALLAGGKRIRPFLVLKTCSLLGGCERDAVPLALAIEMIHTYSLIHDDLPCMDNDVLRRGKPTCHVRFGEANALLAGDGLLTKAFEVVASARSLPSDLRIAAVRILAEASGDCGMLAGQVMDARAEKIAPSEETLLRLHRLKTGALIRAACLLGAVAAGIGPNSEDPRIAAVLQYSENIGIAFQVIDDILDQTGDEATLGKPIGSDRANGKTTFLSFMDLKEAERYAVELTESAVCAIREYDKDGLLSDFAYYLCNRRY